MAHQFPDITTYGAALRFALEAEQACADLAAAAGVLAPDQAWRDKLEEIVCTHDDRVAKLTATRQETEASAGAPVSIDAGAYLGTLDAEPEIHWPGAVEQLARAEEDAGRAFTRRSPRAAASMLGRARARRSRRARRRTAVARTAPRHARLTAGRGGGITMSASSTTPASRRVTLSVPSRPEFLGLVRDTARGGAALAGFRDDARQRVATVVQQLAAILVLAATREVLTVDLTCEVVPGGLSVTLHDDGPPFDPSSAGDADAFVRGLLSEGSADWVEFRNEGRGGKTVRMMFHHRAPRARGRGGSCRGRRRRRGGRRPPRLGPARRGGRAAVGARPRRRGGHPCGGRGRRRRGRLRPAAQGAGRLGQRLHLRHVQADVPARGHVPPAAHRRAERERRHDLGRGLRTRRYRGRPLRPLVPGRRPLRARARHRRHPQGVARAARGAPPGRPAHGGGGETRPVRRVRRSHHGAPLHAASQRSTRHGHLRRTPRDDPGRARVPRHGGAVAPPQLVRHDVPLLRDAVDGAAGGAGAAPRHDPAPLRVDRRARQAGRLAAGRAPGRRATTGRRRASPCD